MSHTLRLVNKRTKKVVSIRKAGIQQYGGTIAFNPSTGRICEVEEVRFNITYNYGCVFWHPDVLGKDGIRSLYGQSFDVIDNRLRQARDAVERMFADQMDVNQFDGKRVEDGDYWKATPRNVIRTLDHMISVLDIVKRQKRSFQYLTLDGD